MNSRKILVTYALPYANGPIHLGHIVGYLQADIWTRFQKMRGHHCIYICGDDAHGTPIMISAQQQNMTPEALIAKIYKEHLVDFQDFHIAFDNYYTTHSPENQALSSLIYQRLHDRGDIEAREIEQAYDPVVKMFLPDRYVKGECPRCSAANQYGDNCEVCGATYSPTDLKNPVSTLSGTTPIQKESLHYFFLLQHYAKAVQDWLTDRHVQPQIANKLQEWFAAGLRPWDISRDAPYFGFEIPNAPGKYFYVWLDAPIGYMASFKKLTEKRQDLSFDDYWGKDSTAELYHFIGKDIIYFHTLFWPALLMAADFRTPTAVFVHGFLTINGQKMSKSRGTYITARQYLEKKLNPEYLRYYFATKLSRDIDDLDLNFEDFAQRVNADLVGKVINIASRCASFINKHFSGMLATELDDVKLFNDFIVVGDCITEHYENRDYQRAIREIMALADIANHYIDTQKPWVLAKDPAQTEKVQRVCTMGLNLFYILMIYLKPILPKMAEKSEAFLNVPATNWKSRTTPLLKHTINTFSPLMERLDLAVLKSLSEE